MAAGFTSEPSEPMPYSTVPISMVADHPPESERKTPASLHKKKPPIIPRKSLKNSVSEVPERSPLGRGAQGGEISEGRTIPAQVDEAQKEGDYLKVVI